MSTFEKKHTEDNTKGFKEAYQVILDYCKKNKNRPMSDLIPGLEGSLSLLNLMEKHIKEDYQVILDYCKKNRPMSDLIPGLEGSLGLLNLMEKHKNGTCSNEDKKEVKR